MNGGNPPFNVAQSLSKRINCNLSASFYDFCPTISNHIKVCILFFTSFTPSILCALMLFLFEERISFSDLFILPVQVDIYLVQMKVFHLSISHNVFLNTFLFLLVFCTVSLGIIGLQMYRHFEKQSKILVHKTLHHTLSI